MAMPVGNTAIVYKTADSIVEWFRVEQWKAFIERADEFFYQFRDGVIGLFERQEKEVLKNLNEEMKAFLGQPNIAPDLMYQFPSATPFRRYSKKGINDILFDEDEWEVVFEEFGQLLLPEIVKDRGDKELGKLQLAVEFDVENPRVVEFLETKVHKFATKPNDTTIAALKKTLTAGISDGEGIRELSARVSHVFDIAKTGRSETIARTEVIGANNFGAFEAYEQSGLVDRKEWLATKDDDTRDSHAAIDGDVVGLHDTFDNGLQFPGDPAGDAEEVINCRCTLLPLVAS